MPADLNVTLDPKATLAILQNTHRHRRNFDQVVYDINTDILQQVSSCVGLKDSLREALRAEAIESDVMTRAKRQMRDLMDTMFQPMVRTIGDDYRIEVRFQGVPLRETQGRSG